MTGAAQLNGAVRGLLRLAAKSFADQPEIAHQLDEQLRRLDQPLRVAIAGKVKAGKSTLLNALVGEQVAATDSAECTRVVTWYQDGPAPAVVMYPQVGAPRPLPVQRHDGALVIDMQATAAEEVERLLVDWPSQSLREMTLIDTPGIASTSAQATHRTVTFLTPADEAVTEADAVVYLMRHLHATDAQFLESFRDQAVSQASSANTVAVLSRADEVGGGRVDAMSSARMIANRYRTEPALRGLCQTVVPVSGLLALTGRTLRRAEFAALTELARLPRAESDAALLSVDRFTSSGTAEPSRLSARAADDIVSAQTRRRLLDRLGLFGIRLSVTLIRQGTDSPAALAGELLRRSGVYELTEVLRTLFTSRRDLLKARSALLLVENALTHKDLHDSARKALAAEIERIVAGAHELTELRLLSAIRSGEITLPDGQAAEAERLLGGSGVSTAVRLGVPADSEREALRHAGMHLLGQWQTRAESPLSGRANAYVCRAVARSCEGMLVALSATETHSDAGSPAKQS